MPHFTQRATASNSHGLASGLRLGLSAILLAVELGLALVQTARAATHDVCPGGTCTYTTIQAAVDAAASGDTISVGAGTYVENVHVVNKSLTFQGAGAAATIVDGNAADRVFTSNTALTLADMTVQNGRVNSNGGGIFAGGALALMNVVVYNNTTAATATFYNGGGAHTDSTLTLSNTQFISNTTGFRGGAAYATGPAVVIGGTF